jgi:predicted tellurium resistance membrane protein TerC
MINQYSFIVIGLLILMTITFLSWRFIGIKYTVPVAGLTFVLLVAFQLALSTNTNTYSSLDAFDNAFPSGNPVFVVLYSDF